jgi:serine/threonine protein kinase
MFIRASYTRGASDIWVLGISLYRMLVGSYPFKATNDRKLIEKMLNADFVIPDHFSEGKITSAPFLHRTTHLSYGIDVKDLLRRMLAPEQSRASLDLIMFHPWLKPYRMVVLPTVSPTVAPPIAAASSQPKTQNPKPKWRRLIKKTCRVILLGPYPPPTRPYRELAHLGR